MTTAPIQGQPLPPDYGPPPYEASQPGFLPPHVPGEGPMPMPMPMSMAMSQPPPGAAHCLHIKNIIQSQSRPINMRQGFSGKCVQCFWKEQHLRVCFIYLFFLSCLDFTSCDVMPKISMVGGGFFLHYCFLRKFNLLARLFSWIWMKCKIQTDRFLIRALGSSRSISVDSVHFLLGTLKKKRGCSSAIKMLFKKTPWIVLELF